MVVPSGLLYPHIDNLSFIIPNHSERFNYWIKSEKIGLNDRASKKSIKTANLI